MKPVPLATGLLLCAMLAACGDATPPGGEPATTATPAIGGPSDILAALPANTRPYGLDVYTAHCASCHGDLGQGVDANPALGGLTRAAIYQKLLDYRAGKAQGEHAAVMAKTVAGLSDAELAAASVYTGE